MPDVSIALRQKRLFSNAGSVEAIVGKARKSGRIYSTRNHETSYYSQNPPNKPKRHSVKPTRKSSLGTPKRLSIESPKKRLETVFLNIYSRLPTSAEIDCFTSLASNQFIFVQSLVHLT